MYDGVRHIARAERIGKRLLVALALATFLIASAAPLPAEDPYPVIKSLTNDDVLYRQLEDNVALYYQRIQNGKPPPPLGIFAYRTRKGDDLYGIAAQVNLPYETIATANHLVHPEAFAPGTHLIIPNMPGLFVPAVPRTELDYLMTAWRTKTGDAGQFVNLIEGGDSGRYYFVPGARFHPLERAYFLNVLFRFPLPKAVVTSRFGMRVDPFTRQVAFHSGIDLAAPWGTDVYAARSGTVAEVGRDFTYGNYIILDHSAGYQTVYGHLSSILVRLHEEVTSGMIIGKVGSSGLSTGPHLHFEIRLRGRPEDPAPLLPMDGR